MNENVGETKKKHEYIGQLGRDRIEKNFCKSDALCSLQAAKIWAARTVLSCVRKKCCDMHKVCIQKKNSKKNGGLVEMFLGQCAAQKCAVLFSFIAIMARPEQHRLPPKPKNQFSAKTDDGFVIGFGVLSFDGKDRPYRSKNLTHKIFPGGSRGEDFDFPQKQFLPGTNRALKKILPPR